MQPRATRVFCSTFVAAAAIGSLVGCTSNGTIGGNKKDLANGGASASAAAGSGGGVSSPGVAGGASGSSTSPPAPGTPLTVTAGATGTTTTTVSPAQALLRSRCAGCHTYGQADPAGWGAALDTSRMTAADIVVPGDPDSSRMIDRVAVAGDMPPAGDRLTSDEVTVLKDWITNLKKPPTTLQSDTDVLDAIVADQLTLGERDNDFRYVSFANFSNGVRNDTQIAAMRHAFTFVLNSLSRRGQIVDLPTIDAAQSIFRVRLADLGWDAKVWDTITSFYPYCLRSNLASHEALYAQLGTESPVVRGDWFLATATKQPLYNFLVQVPATLDQLAATLGININDDINHLGKVEPDNLLRIGFQRSGVALHNRMIERHLGKQGQALWVSYDFDSNDGTSDVLANPLGPKLRDQQNFVHTFQNAGGMVIYTMPNGLQGYMVVDAVGNSLDAVPIAIARDPHRRDAVVANGLSCFGCHANSGILRPRTTDETPLYSDAHLADFQGRELDEIDASYPRALSPDPIAADVARYRANVSTVPGGGPVAGQAEYTDFTTLLGEYESNLGFHGAAAEFNQDFDTFRTAVLANDSQDDSLPLTTKASLISRDDFVCLFRDLAPKIVRNAAFCAGTFTANQVKSACSGSVATGSGGRGGSSGSTGTGGAGGTSGVSGSSGTGGSSGNTGTGGSGGTSGTAGSSGTSGTGCRTTIVNGRRVCR